MNLKFPIKPCSAIIATVFTVMLAQLAPAQAQVPFPSKPMKLIVPLAPSGGADAVAHMLGKKMSPSLGQPIVIENKAGASGSIAAMEVARAAPDGYTLMQCFVATHGTNPAVLKLKYDPIADLSPVGMMAQASNVLVDGDRTAAKALQEFLSLARAKPGATKWWGLCAPTKTPEAVVNRLCGDWP